MSTRTVQLVTSIMSVLALTPELFGQVGGDYDAPKRTMSIDGDLSDWSGADHGVLSHSHRGDGSNAPISIAIRYAWDDDNLYTMVLETSLDDDIVEGVDREDWLSGPDSTGPAVPWGTDSVGFYDVPANEIGYAQTGPKTQWWIGLSSNAEEEDQVRHMVRTLPEIDSTTELITGQAANFFEGGLRGVEFSMAWDDIRYDENDPNVVPGHSRQDVQAGYTFRLDPLLVDGVGDGSEYHGQSYPGGSERPALVAIEDTSFVVLIEGDSLVCDFDGNTSCDLADIDDLVGEIIDGSNNTNFDLTGDGGVDLDDRDRWLADAATENGFAGPYLLGDADIDGVVNATDLNVLGISWQMGATAWSQGDFTADGFVDASDLNAIGINWQQSIPIAAAVPEPAAFVLSLGVFLLLGFRPRLTAHAD